MRLTKINLRTDEDGEAWDWAIIDANNDLIDIDDDWDYLEGRAISAGIIIESLSELIQDFK